MVILDVKFLPEAIVTVPSFPKKVIEEAVVSAPKATVPAAPNFKVEIKAAPDKVTVAPAPFAFNTFKEFEVSAPVVVVTDPEPLNVTVPTPAPVIVMELIALVPSAIVNVPSFVENAATEVILFAEPCNAKEPVPVIFTVLTFAFPLTDEAPTPAFNTFSTPAPKASPTVPVKAVAPANVTVPVLAVVVVTFVVAFAAFAKLNVPSFPANAEVVIVFAPVAFRLTVPAPAYVKLVAEVVVPLPPKDNVPVLVMFIVVA